METISGDAVAIVQAEREAQVREAAAQGATWSLESWENYLNAINPNYMELGLKRVGIVAQRLNIQARLHSCGTKVVTVAGTNGKGSTCALVAQAMSNLGFKVGLYTSPHLIHFNERIQINSQNIADEPLCRCLYQVIKAQLGSAEADQDGYIDLSYFEIITLAAWLAFLEAQCEILVLEIGLGGRLDAVNLLQHDVSIITSIGLDHMKILGDSVAKIAFEKAGVIHPQDYTIVGSNIPAAALEVIKQVAAEQKATLYQEDVAFKVGELKPNVKSNINGDVKADARAESAVVETLSANPNFITFSSNLFAQAELQNSAAAFPSAADLAASVSTSVGLNLSLLSNVDVKTVGKRLTLAFPKVPFICTGPALQAVFFLMAQMGCKVDAVSIAAINQALSTVALPGRMQKVHDEPAVYLDVAHNVPAAQHLKVELKQHLAGYQRRLVVIGMLKDKDIEGVLAELKDSFDAFYVASLHVPRGETKERLVEALESMHLAKPIMACETVAEALSKAQQAAQKDDVIVVMGSFVTVAEAQQSLA